MITVLWTGIFKSNGHKPLTVQFAFSGRDLNDIRNQIRNYVEDKENNSEEEWVLSYNAITHIRRLPCSHGK